MPSDDVAIFGKRLKEAMQARGLKARQVAKLTGIDESRISRYVHGLYAPKRQAVFAISRALRVNPSWLLGFSDEMSEELPEKDRARNELENLIEDMDQEQIEKTLRFVRDYILK